MSTQFSFVGKQVLIVDDQRAFQIMLRSMLQNFGATDFHFAASGEAAIRTCQKYSFDILLVDYNLGTGKNGAQLLEELRLTKAISPSALYIIISGDNNRSMVLNALEMEPDDFLTKPFSQYQLINRIARAYQKRQELLPIYTHLDEHQYQSAVETCKSYIRDQGRYQSYCHNLMIESFIHLQDYENAHIHLCQQLKEHPQTWALATLGQVQFLMGDYAKSIHTLELVIEEHPLILLAYDHLAKAYRANNQLPEALSIIQKANQISPYSISRQQLMAELALDSHNLSLAKETFGRILQLARRSIHRGPQHLCNFIRSLIDEAQNEEDLYRKNRLLQEVNSVLHKARYEEGNYDGFDFEAFEGLSQARVHATKGEMHRAKQILFSSNEGALESPEQIDDILLPDTFLTLNSVGEYEYAVPLADELKKRDKLEYFSTLIANKLADSPAFVERLDTFRALNHQGITSYSEGNYLKACQYFRKALKEAPGNTGAILNKIQAILKFLETSTGRHLSELEECKQAIKSLDGLHLSESHKQRLQSLREEFETLVNLRNSGSRS
ncbi:response regulator [Celerinatantimonas sp. YJH-8]|uniref:response regulator n=1 Tax=Celerinatantimonas sp. YJH-8 TaxID=3228714 RepID=UPI0038BE3357